MAIPKAPVSISCRLRTAAAARCGLGFLPTRSISAARVLLALAIQPSPVRRRTQSRFSTNAGASQHRGYSRSLSAAEKGSSSNRPSITSRCHWRALFAIIAKHRSNRSNVTEAARRRAAESCTAHDGKGGPPRFLKSGMVSFVSMPSGHLNICAMIHRSIGRNSAGMGTCWDTRDNAAWTRVRYSIAFEHDGASPRPNIRARMRTLAKGYRQQRSCAAPGPSQRPRYKIISQIEKPSHSSAN